MKKVLVVLLMLTIGLSLTFANGASETNTNEKAGTTSYSGANTAGDMTGLIQGSANGSAGVMGDFIMSFSTILDKMTSGVCLALTPYPKALELFYPDLFDSSELGVDNKYAEYGVTTQDVFMNKEGSLSSTNLADQGLSTKSTDAQKATTNMLMIVIVSLFLIEILFSVIYSYITGGEEPILKTLLVKAVTCLLIGALIMSLPFIIEAFKWGFDKVVKIMSGADQNKEVPELATTKERVYQEAVKSTPFQYPGLLLRLVTMETINLDPDVAGITDMFVKDDDTFLNIKSGVSAVIVNMLFFVVKIVIFLIAIISALHIMFNIVEVYILMSLALILLPFQIFRLTSFMGTGVFRSLMSNIIQLAVICFIIIAVVPLTSDVSVNLWSSIQSVKDNLYEAGWKYSTFNSDRASHKSSVYQFLYQYEDAYDGGGTLYKQLGADKINWTNTVELPENDPSTGKPKESTFAKLFNTVGFEAGVSYLDAGSSSTLKTTPRITVTLYPTAGAETNGFATWGVDNFGKVSNMIAAAIQDIINHTYNTYYRHFGMEQDQYNLDKIDNFEDVPQAVKYVVGVTGGTMDSAETQKYFNGQDSKLTAKFFKLDNNNASAPNLLTVEKIPVSDSPSAWSLTFSYLATALCMAYLQCFFIQRSSQITEGLLNGRDSGPDFGRLLSARAVGGVARAAGKVATAPVRGGAALATTGARLATANIGQSLSNSGHTALGGMLMALSRVGSTQGQSAATIGNQKTTEANTTNRDSKNG